MVKPLQAQEPPQLQELWQPPAPSRHLTIAPEALQQPRDGYKGNATLSSRLLLQIHR